MSARTRRLGRTVASVMALGVLGFLVWRARPLDLLAHLTSADLWVLGLAMTLNFAQVWFKSLRLRTLLDPVAQVPLGRLYRYTLIGYAGNNVLPVRGGEVVRLTLLQKREQVSVGAFVGVFSGERILDAASVLCVAAALPLLAPLPSSVRLGLGLLLGAALGGYVVLLFLSANRGTPPPDAGRVRRFLADLGTGARALCRPLPLLSGLASSLGALACEALIIVCVMRAMSIPLSAAAIPLLILCVNLAIVAPSAPSHLGAFEAGAVIALTLCGVGETAALAFALLYHAVHLVPVTVAGAVAYARLPAVTQPAPGSQLVPRPVEVDR